MQVTIPINRQTIGLKQPSLCPSARSDEFRESILVQTFVYSDIYGTAKKAIKRIKKFFQNPKTNHTNQIIQWLITPKAFQINQKNYKTRIKNQIIYSSKLNETIRKI